MKIVKSQNRTEKGRWNNFNSNVLDNFVRSFKPKFVDVIGLAHWQNKEDMVVIELPSKVDWFLVDAYMRLYADEFDFHTISKKSVVIRLWWD